MNGKKKKKGSQVAQFKVEILHSEALKSLYGTKIGLIIIKQLDILKSLPVVFRT